MMELEVRFVLWRILRPARPDGGGVRLATLSSGLVTTRARTVWSATVRPVCSGLTALVQFWIQFISGEILEPRQRILVTSGHRPTSLTTVGMAIRLRPI